MFHKSFVKRAGALALSLVLSASLVPWSRAAAPVVDESYYGTLDYYGALTEGSVVKSYRLNGNTDLADVGDYTQVNNLTDRTQPEVEGDHVYFHLTDDSLKNFYFEGKTDKPFREMPFLISISYKMNGVECDAEDMAGQTGLAEITLDVKPNPLASAYQRNNFALEAATLCKDSKLLSIEAPGGQLQKVGDMDVALYLVLPGEERSFTLRIGSEDFSFPGFTFLCQPATLAQLDQIDELREAKEELEDSARDISDSFDDILADLDKLSGTSSDLRRTADGLDQLNRARAAVSAGKGRVYDQADRTLASLTDLTESLKPAVEHIKTGKDALAESTEQLTALTGTVDGLRPELLTLRDDLADLRQDANALNATLELLKADGLTARDQLGTINGDLGDLNGQLDLFKGDVGNIGKDLKALRSELDDLNTDLDTLQEDLNRVSSRSGSLKTAMDRLDLGETALEPIRSVNVGGTDYTPAQIQEAYGTAESVYKVCAAGAAAGLPDTYVDDPSLSLADREAALAAFIAANSGDIARALVLGDPNGVSQVEAKAQAITTEKISELSGFSQDDPAFTAAYTALYPTVYPTVYGQVLEAAAATYQASLADPDNAARLAYLHYEWTEGTNIKQSLQTLDTFNSVIGTANTRLGDLGTQLGTLRTPASNLYSALMTLLDHTSGDTLEDARDLLGDTQSLLSTAQTALDHTQGTLDTAGTSLEDAQALLGTAQDLIDHVTGYDTQALNDHANHLFDTMDASIGQLDAVLDQTVQLSQTVTRYEPDAQAALDAAQSQVDAAVGLLGSLNTFSRSLEDLMKLAGTDLDRGTENALRGLSGTLRTASDSFSSTSSLRRTKETVERLVREKWEEYTGGENNLLNMDADAEMVSLTSPENPTPNTIQLVLRSQEIKVSEDEKQTSAGSEEEQLSFWGRVGRMFHDFGAIFTGD